MSQESQILRVNSGTLTALKKLQSTVQSMDTAKITQIYHDDGVSVGYYITNSGMDLTVSQTGTYVLDNLSTAIVQGKYIATEDTEAVITVADGDVTNPRYDIVYAGKFGIALAQGTPASSPSDPTLPTDVQSLYRITVPANETDGSGLVFTDLRTYITTGIESTFLTEHNTDGTHSDITASSVTVSGAISTLSSLTANSATVSTALSVLGDLTADTDTLHVDSTNNRVGIGTTSPLLPIEANGSTNVGLLKSSTTDCWLFFENSTVTGGYNTVGIASSGDDLRIRTGDADAVRVKGDGKVGIGTTSPTALLDVNTDVLRLRTSKTPTSATDTGNAGDICWDSSYIYVCVATNTWKRATISTW